MNVPKSRKPLAIKNILTTNIQQVFVTWIFLMMPTMKTKGFMIRIRGEKNFVPQNSRNKKSSISLNPYGTGKPSQIQQLCDYYLLGP
jgi:type IV secretory pathway component VirB8